MVHIGFDSTIRARPIVQDRKSSYVGLQDLCTAWGAHNRFRVRLQGFGER